MQAEFPRSRTRHLRNRRSLTDRVQEALIRLSGGKGRMLSHEEKAWASITFAGTRHELLIDFAGPEAIEAGERFIAELPDHEFAIPGQLVADAAIEEVHHTTLPEPRLMVTLALLLLEEA